MRVERVLSVLGVLDTTKVVLVESGGSDEYLRRIRIDATLARVAEIGGDHIVLDLVEVRLQYAFESDGKRMFKVCHELLLTVCIAARLVTSAHFDEDRALIAVKSATTGHELLIASKPKLVASASPTGSERHTVQGVRNDGSLPGLRGCYIEPDGYEAIIH